jgi:hypothetical protein
MAAPNLINVTSVFGKNTATTIGTAITVLLSNPSTSSKSYKITTLYVANIDNTLTGRISVDFYRSNISIRLIDRMPVDPGNSLVVMTRDSAIYLEEGDSIRAYSDQVGLIHVNLGYEISA